VVLEDHDAATIPIGRHVHPDGRLVRAGFGDHRDGLAPKCDRLGYNVLAGCDKYLIPIISCIYPGLYGIKGIACTRAYGDSGSLRKLNIAKHNRCHKYNKHSLHSVTI
jgi:hypothetical protein